MWRNSYLYNSIIFVKAWAWDYPRNYPCVEIKIHSKLIIVVFKTHSQICIQKYNVKYVSIIKADETVFAKIDKCWMFSERVCALGEKLIGKLLHFNLETHCVLSTFDSKKILLYARKWPFINVWNCFICPKRQHHLSYH